MEHGTDAGRGCDRATQAWLAGEPPVLSDDVDTAIRFYPASTRMNKSSYMLRIVWSPL
jgi:hypothetical protein